MVTEERVPTLIPVPVVAEATGFTYLYARSIMERSGVLVRRGRLLKAQRELLQERLPEVFEEVVAHYEKPDASRHSMDQESRAT
jgi:hypothetical protein